MILSDEKRFAYVHIPKCAGSTIRFWMENKISCDPRFNGYVDIPGLGCRHSAHLPLHLIQAHYPDAYEKLQAYRVVAVTRDPFSRFQSAFAQYQRQFFERNVEIMKRREVEAALVELRARLQAGAAESDPDLMHFQRQADFVFNRGMRVVKELYPISSLDRLISEMAQIFEIPPPSTPPRNVRRSHRFPLLKGTLTRVKRGTQAVLPHSVWKPAHDWALGLFTDQGIHSDLKMSRDMEEFIADHYASDMELHREAQMNFSTKDRLASARSVEARPAT